jgi:hypothetical protein
MKNVLKRGAQLAGLVGLILLLAFIAGVLWPASPLMTPPHTPARIALTNITAIDIERGVPVPHRTVIISGDRITTIGHVDSVSLPASTIRVDGTNRYLLPGLWDMHTHLLRMSPRLHYPLFIAFGVTNIRDMGLVAPSGCQGNSDPFFLCPGDKRAWNQQVDAGTLVGPRLMSTPVFQIESLADLGLSTDSSDLEATEAAVGALVQTLAQRGVDFIKLQLEEPLPSPVLAALLDHAQAVGLPVVGHPPGQLNAVEAARFMRSIEHARVFVQACFPGAASYRKGDVDWSAQLYHDMIDQHDPVLCNAVFDAFIAHDTWFCPTHITRRWEAMYHDADYRQDVRLNQVPMWQRLVWNIDAYFIGRAAATPEAQSALMDFYRFGLTLTGRAHQRGVKVLAGTDALDSYAFYGSGLHDELEELVKAGLSPAEALQTATLNPARFFGVDADYGSISVGKKADLVVLAANPLQDIQHTRRIEVVLFDGRLYDRSHLDRLIQSVENAASSWPMNCKAVWRMIRSAMGV